MELLWHFHHLARSLTFRGFTLVSALDEIVGKH